jgi:hypothetical protein
MRILTQEIVLPTRPGLEPSLIVVVHDVAAV